MDSGTSKEVGTGGSDDLVASATDGMLGPNPFIGLRPQDIVATAQRIVAQAIKQPALVMEQEAALARELMALLSGSSTLAPRRDDRRFADLNWRDNLFYRMTLGGYLAWTNSLMSFVDRSALDDKTKERARFVTGLFTDALAPTNTLFGNPAALRKLVESRGASLVAGLRNMWADLTTNQGMPAQVDKTAFRVGKNLALSPGEVVFRNEVLELIQYAPATPQVHARPHVIIPPQINKFYVFDLSRGKSIVEYLVMNNFQVFIVSWRNPMPAQRDWGLDTYVAALLEAIVAAREIAGAEDVNLHGACSGALTMSALLGYLAAKREPLAHAATLMVAVFDAGADSQLGMFATPETIAAAKQNSWLKGVLDGEEMARVFAWLRPNDLVWNYWVNNYLMGNPPPAFDVLYWNNDTTRLPAKFHGDLVDILTDRQFEKRGALKVLGSAIDLSQVDIDKYLVAGVTDHITPWKGVYGTARTFGGRNDFILSSSGHIQSLINPPGNPKARFFLNSDLPADPDKWLGAAEAKSGSWWEHWKKWLAERSGDMRAARDSLGSSRNSPGSKAPGTYVFEP